MNYANRERALIRHLRAHFAARRLRRLAIRRLRESAAEDRRRAEEIERSRAWWRAEAVHPEAMRIAAEMAVRHG